MIRFPGVAAAANVTYLTMQVRKGDADVRAMVVGIAPGRSVELSRVMLGGAGPLPQGHAAPRLMVPLGPQGPVVAISTAAETAFVIDPMPALNGQPASDGTRLRGGRPLRVGLLRSSLGLQRIRR